MPRSPAKTKAKTKAKTLFTIGYEKARPQAVLDELKEAGVKLLVDTRAVAASRRPGFSKRALAASLGDVKNLASIRLNGRELGAVWCPPWSLAVPADLLKPAGNRLEVTVANLWINRLIGDAALPPDQRFAFATRHPYKADSPLQPSGLLGPVRVLRTSERR